MTMNQTTKPPALVLNSTPIEAVAFDNATGYTVVRAHMRFTLKPLAGGFQLIKNREPSGRSGGAGTFFKDLATAAQSVRAFSTLPLYIALGTLPSSRQ
jgi:hypothetical protein